MPLSGCRWLAVLKSGGFWGTGLLPCYQWNQSYILQRLQVFGMNLLRSREVIETSCQLSPPLCCYVFNRNTSRHSDCFIQLADFGFPARCMVLRSLPNPRTSTHYQPTLWVTLILPKTHLRILPPFNSPLKPINRSTLNHFFFSSDLAAWFGEAELQRR